MKKKIIVISDVDGILTNGQSIYTVDGKVGKVFGSYDKESVIYAKQFGVEFLFVSSDKNGWPITSRRLSEWKEKEWCDYMLADDVEREKIIEDYKNKGYYVIFIGDSISDIPAGNKANYFATTNNAFDKVKTQCDYVSSRDGGNGGFAEIIYKII